MSTSRTIGIKALSLALAFGITVGSVFVALPAPKAEAQLTVNVNSVGAVEGTVLATALIHSAAANTATAAATAGSFTITNILNGIAWTVAKVAVQSITKSMVNWITSGYQGSPAFVTDLSKNLRQVGDATASAFITQLTTDASINSPYINDIAQAAGAAYYLSTNKNAIAQQLKYTLDTVSQNDRAFVNGDFQQGGFDAWFAMTQNPANNPFGANFIVGQALSKQVVDSTNTRLKELDFGKGFLSFRGSCATPAPADGSTSLNDSDKCLSYNIVTPGSIVEDQLAMQLGSPVRQLELANSINEIISAAATQLVGQVISSTGLLGSNAPASGGGNSALYNATNPAAYSGNNASLTQGFSQTLSTEVSQMQTYQQNWQKILNAASAAQVAAAGNTCSAGDPATIQQTIGDANTEISAASDAITSLKSLQTQVAAEQSASPSVQASQLSAITSQYQSLLASSDTPSDSDFTYAAAQSTDTGATTPASLYTQMVTIQNGGNCGRNILGGGH